MKDGWTLSTLTSWDSLSPSRASAASLCWTSPHRAGSPGSGATNPASAVHATEPSMNTRDKRKIKLYIFRQICYTVAVKRPDSGLNYCTDLWPNNNLRIHVMLVCITSQRDPVQSARSGAIFRFTGFISIKRSEKMPKCQLNCASFFFFRRQAISDGRIISYLSCVFVWKLLIKCQQLLWPKSKRNYRDRTGGLLYQVGVS